LGATPSSAEDDFFDLGGGSLAAAQLVSRLRSTYPEVTVADVYDHPQIGALARALDELGTPASYVDRTVRPVPRVSQVVQVLLTVPLRSITGLRWLTWTAIGSTLASAWLGMSWLPRAPWPALVVAWLALVSAPGRMLLTGLGARLILAGVAPGEYARGGPVHVRVWTAERLAEELGAANLAGAPLMRWYARLLGADVGRHVDLHSIPPVTGHLVLGDGCSIEPEVDLSGHWVDGDVLRIGAVRVGADARVGARSTLAPGAVVGDGAEIAAGSAVFGEVPTGQLWAGAPAEPRKNARGPWDARPADRPAWIAAYAASAVLIAALPGVALLAAMAVSSPALRSADSLSQAAVRALVWLPVATVVGLVVLAVLIVALVRALSWGLAPGAHAVHGLRAWQAWSILRVLDEARTWLFPVYSSSLTPLWLRWLGADVGPGVEASTVLLIPKLTSVREGAFLADDTLIGGYELGGGWLRIDEVVIGKHAFVGNSGMAAPGRKVPKRGLVAVLSAAPRRAKAKAGTSWLGSPPTKLRRVEQRVDRSRTYEPPRRLVIARAAVELCRLVPVMVAMAIGLGVVVALLAAAATYGWWWPVVLSGLIVIAAATVAAGATTAAKWLLVGRLRVGDHPLWSSFVWRNELADTFVEAVAAPWFARPATGTPVLNLWLRSLGATIGRGVWCETYWLPEADLIALQAGSTVNQGCVVQTHLFHDRVLSMDRVSLRAGATLGPNSVILPAATLGRHSTVGPVSLVMRGEFVPDRTRWIGNPIGPWQQSTAEAGA
ncbi:MAG TPA: Pls/PosA family non-ribosomal peptide synthetase, partial [Candidatus Nanopelagicales bacterium]|nr:Pls/PosA family non-ribosomal peptide synthetase [Candidatus Nanopelagicales bacterium]